MAAFSAIADISSRTAATNPFNPLIIWLNNHLNGLMKERVFFLQTHKKAAFSGCSMKWTPPFRACRHREMLLYIKRVCVLRWMHTERDQGGVMNQQRFTRTIRTVWSRAVCHVGGRKGVTPICSSSATDCIPLRFTNSACAAPPHFVICPGTLTNAVLTAQTRLEAGGWRRG